MAGLLGRGGQPPDQRPDDRPLVRGGQVGPAALDLGLVELPHRVEQGGLQPGEREVEAGHAGDGEREGLGIAVAGEPVELGAARVAEPQQPRALVERLAGGVVERRAEHLEARRLDDGEQERVPAAREEAGERRLEGLGPQVERRDVRAEMVDRHEREAARPGDRLRGREADEQRADETGALGDGDPADVVEAPPRVVERRAQDRRNELEVPSRGDLRHHAAVPRVELGLRGDDRGEQLAVLGDDGGGRLVAGRLEAEDEPAHAAPSGSGSASRHMISASSRLSV